MIELLLFSGLVEQALYACTRNVIPARGSSSPPDSRYVTRMFCALRDLFSCCICHICTKLSDTLWNQIRLEFLECIMPFYRLCVELISFQDLSYNATLEKPMILSETYSKHTAYTEAFWFSEKSHHLNINFMLWFQASCPTTNPESRQCVRMGVQT